MKGERRKTADLNLLPCTFRLYTSNLKAIYYVNEKIHTT